MFIDRLSHCERQILMDLLIHVARCDKEFSQEERSYIDNIGIKYNLKVPFEPERSVEVLCQAITEYQSKVIILQELIRLAKIDNDYHQEERDVVEDVIEYFDIKYEKYLALKRWVDAGIQWLKDGEKHISDDDV